jgi:hypothetical protein
VTAPAPSAKSASHGIGGLSAEAKPQPSMSSATCWRADHAAHMDRRGAKDFGAAMRVAKRLGSNEIAIVQACAAMRPNSTKAKPPRCGSQ